MKQGPYLKNWLRIQLEIGCCKKQSWSKQNFEKLNMCWNIWFGLMIFCQIQFLYGLFCFFQPIWLLNTYAEKKLELSLAKLSPVFLFFLTLLAKKINLSIFQYHVFCFMCPFQAVSCWAVSVLHRYYFHFLRHLLYIILFFSLCQHWMISQLKKPSDTQNIWFVPCCAN